MEARSTLRRVTPPFLRGIARSASRQRNRLVPERLRWRAGIRSELRFWRNWLSEGIASGDPKVLRRLDPDAPSDDTLAALLERMPAEEISILDVGAGPLTNLGKRMPGKRLRITAVDPLAEGYRSMLDEVGVTAPVETIHGEAESLAEQFGEDSFDVVHAANALDHARDPLQAITSMLAVLRPGGLMLLRHNVNEAEANQYHGFHQWNFDLRDGSFVIWNQATVKDVSEALRGRADVECRIESRRLICVITKPAE
jgi:SAM-dependent methyltransferase